MASAALPESLNQDNLPPPVALRSIPGGADNKELAGLVADLKNAKSEAEVTKTTSALERDNDLKKYEAFMNQCVKVGLIDKRNNGSYAALKKGPNALSKPFAQILNNSYLRVKGKSETRNEEAPKPTPAATPDEAVTETRQGVEGTVEMSPEDIDKQIVKKIRKSDSVEQAAQIAQEHLKTKSSKEEGRAFMDKCAEAKLIEKITEKDPKTEREYFKYGPSESMIVKAYIAWTHEINKAANQLRKQQRKEGAESNTANETPANSAIRAFAEAKDLKEVNKFADSLKGTLLNIDEKNKVFAIENNPDSAKVKKAYDQAIERLKLKEENTKGDTNVAKNKTSKSPEPQRPAAKDLITISTEKLHEFGLFEGKKNKIPQAVAIQAADQIQDPDKRKKALDLISELVADKGEQLDRRIQEVISKINKTTSYNFLIEGMARFAKEERLVVQSEFNHYEPSKFASPSQFQKLTKLIEAYDRKWKELLGQRIDEVTSKINNEDSFDNLNRAMKQFAEDDGLVIKIGIDRYIPNESVGPNNIRGLEKLIKAFNSQRESLGKLVKEYYEITKDPKESATFVIQGTPYAISFKYGAGQKNVRILKVVSKNQNAEDLGLPIGIFQSYDDLNDILKLHVFTKKNGAIELRKPKVPQKPVEAKSETLAEKTAPSGEVSNAEGSGVKVETALDKENAA